MGKIGGVSVPATVPVPISLYVFDKRATEFRFCYLNEFSDHVQFFESDKLTTKKKKKTFFSALYVYVLSSFNRTCSVPNAWCSPFDDFFSPFSGLSLEWQLAVSAI